MDSEAGPHKNYTVVFIGAESGVVLKVLAKTPSMLLDDSLLLEEIDVFNKAKYGYTHIHFFILTFSFYSHLLSLSTGVYVCLLNLHTMCLLSFFVSLCVNANLHAALCQRLTSCVNCEKALCALYSS